MVVERVDNQENCVDSQQPVDTLASSSCEDDVDVDTVTLLPPFQVPQERKVSYFPFHVVRIDKCTFFLCHFSILIVFIHSYSNDPVLLHLLLMLGSFQVLNWPHAAQLLQLFVKLMWQQYNTDPIFVC